MLLHRYLDNTPWAQLGDMFHPQFLTGTCHLSKPFVRFLIALQLYFLVVMFFFKPYYLRNKDYKTEPSYERKLI